MNYSDGTLLETPTYSFKEYVFTSHGDIFIVGTGWPCNAPDKLGEAGTDSHKGCNYGVFKICAKIFNAHTSPIQGYFMAIFRRYAGYCGANHARTHRPIHRLSQRCQQFQKHHTNPHKIAFYLSSRLSRYGEHSGKGQESSAAAAETTSHFRKRV